MHTWPPTPAPTTTPWAIASGSRAISSLSAAALSPTTVLSTGPASGSGRPTGPSAPTGAGAGAGGGGVCKGSVSGTLKLKAFCFCPDGQHATNKLATSQPASYVQAGETKTSTSCAYHEACTVCVCVCVRVRVCVCVRVCACGRNSGTVARRVWVYGTTESRAAAAGVGLRHFGNQTVASSGCECGSTALRLCMPPGLNQNGPTVKRLRPVHGRRTNCSAGAVAAMADYRTCSSTATALGAAGSSATADVIL